MFWLPVKICSMLLLLVMAQAGHSVNIGKMKLPTVAELEACRDTNFMAHVPTGMLKILKPFGRRFPVIKLTSVTLSFKDDYCRPQYHITLAQYHKDNRFPVRGWSVDRSPRALDWTKPMNPTQIFPGESTHDTFFGADYLEPFDWTIVVRGRMSLETALTRAYAYEKINEKNGVSRLQGFRCYEISIRKLVNPPLRIIGSSGILFELKYRHLKDPTIPERSVFMDVNKNSHKTVVIKHPPKGRWISQS